MRRRNVEESILYFAALFFMACSPTATSKVAPAESPAQQAPVFHRAIDGWQRIGDAPGNSNGRGIQCVKDDVCWLYDSKTLWQSRDGGQSWLEVNEIVGNEPPLGYHFVTAEIGWKYSWAGVFKSIDGGHTWVRKATPLDSLNGEVRTVWFLKDGKIGWLGGGIYRPQTKEELRLGVPNNTKDVTGKKVLEEAIFRSDDGGETWQTQSLPVAIWGRLLNIKFLDENHGVTMGEHVVYYTYNGGKSWGRPAFKKGCVREKYLNDYYDAGPEYVEMLNSNLWWLSFSDGRIVKSIDGGRSWCDLLHPGRVAFSQGGPEYFASLHFDRPQHGWGLGWDRFVYETTDGGANWKRLTSDVTVESMFFANRSEGLVVSNEGVFRIKS